MSMGWTSPILPKLQGDNSPLPRKPTLKEESWIGSLLNLGAVCGPLIMIPLSQYIGRRWIIISTNVPLLLGWLLAVLATNLEYIYVARLMWGCATGMQFAVVPIYVGEIAEDQIRGRLTTLFFVFINLGYLLALSIGSFASYWGLTATSGILSLLYLPFTFFIPESPFFLVYKGHVEKASKVLQQLRGTSQEAVQPELEVLQTMMTREFKKPLRLNDLWATKGSLKALGICVFLATLVQLSGIDVFLFYMENLMTKVGSVISAAQGSIVVAAVQVATSCVTPLVVDRLGRKPLMCITSLGLAILLGLIGIYAMLDSYYKVDVARIALVPLLCFMFYMMLFTLGVGPVPWVLVAEMFPVKTKCLAGGIASFFCWLTGFISTRFFYEIAASCGIYTAFWILAAFCVIGFIFSATMLPETKGKTFAQIQDILNRSGKRSSR